MRIDLGSKGFIEVAPPVMEPVEQIMRMLEAEFEARGWDKQPLYFYLFTTDQGIGAQNLNLPGDLYKDPGRYLPEFAQYISEDGPLSQIGRLVLGRQIMSKFYGIGVVNEGWGVKELQKEEAEDISAGRAPLPSQRPDRIELRMVHVVTVDGRVAGLSRERGHEPVFVEYSIEIDEAGEIRETIQGRIPAALRLLCDSMERICG